MDTISKLRRVGWVVSSLPILFMFVDALGKLLEPAPVVEGTVRLGFPVNSIFGMGVIELVGTTLYAVPRTSTLGAVLLTAFLGGATAAHVRLEEPFWFPIMVGVLVWGGLALREPQIRRLLGASSQH